MHFEIEVRDLSGRPEVRSMVHYIAERFRAANAQAKAELQAKLIEECEILATELGLTFRASGATTPHRSRSVS